MNIPIPQVQRSVDPQVGGVPLLREPSNQGLQDLGQGLQQLSNVQVHQATLLEHEQMKSRVLDRARDDRLKWTQELDSRQTAAAPGADGFTPTTLKDFDTYRKQRADSVADPRERRMYDDMLGALREHVGEHAVAFEAASRRSFRQDTLVQGIDKSARTVAIDPTQFKDALAQELVSINGSTDLTAPAKAKLAEKARDLLSLSAGQTMVNRDPAAWLKATETPEAASAHPVIPFLPPEHMNALANHARVLLAQQASRADLEAARRMKIAEQSTDELKKFWLDGAAPDMAYIAKVRADTAGTPFAPQVDMMVDQAQKGAGHGSLPLPQQMASIRAVEAQLAKGSNPEAEGYLAYARTVTSRQETAYRENPWAAYARFAKGPAVPDTPLPSADAVPQYVAQALPYMNGVEAASGMPASPLQPAQAQQFAAQLQALPPQQRSEVLGQTGELLRSTPDRINALAAQIDGKDRPMALAFKLGADRTTYGRMASELVLRGADALKDKTVKRDDQALIGWRSEISALIRGTLGDQKAENDAIDAAYYARAAMDEPGYQGRASNEQAVRLILGHPLDRAGVKTILPRGMDEGQFTEKLRQYTPEALTSLIPSGVVYVRGQPRKLDQLSSALPGMGMKRNPAGGYTPVSGGAFITLDPEGQIPLNLPVQ